MSSLKVTLTKNISTEKLEEDGLWRAKT